MARQRPSQSRQRAVLAIVIVSTILISRSLWFSDRSSFERVLTPNGRTLVLELADSSSKRERGLARRTHVAGDGMLFVWKRPGSRPIWMSEMLFPIDIVWCDAAGRVLAVKRSVPPCSPGAECPLYGTELQDVTYVLELLANSSTEAELIPGKYIRIGGAVQ